jgi:hypothetical protein
MAACTNNLAAALLWKLDHPQQHSSQIDSALGEFVDAADLDAQAEREGKVGRILYPPPSADLIARAREQAR